MSRILLDTFAYSAFMRREAIITSTVQTAEEICLNPVVLGELISGFIRGKSEKRNRKELQELLASPRVSILSIDEETSERYAIILCDLRKRGTPVPTNDIWIAASAMQYGLKVLTTDSHYKRVSQIVTEYCSVS